MNQTSQAKYHLSKTKGGTNSDPVENNRKVSRSRWSNELKIKAIDNRLSKKNLSNCAHALTMSTRTIVKRFRAKR